MSTDNLANIINLNYKKYTNESQFDSETIFVAIMDNGTPVRCIPQTYHNISCPMCGSKNGSRIPNNKDYWWACSNSDCIERNRGVVAEKAHKEVDILDIMDKMGVTKRLRNASFDDWKHNLALKEQLVKYSRDPTEALILTGTNGTGKSFSAVAIAREYYLRTMEIPIFYNVSELYQEWLANSKSPINLMNKIVNAKLLVLDDLGIRTPTEGFCDFLYVVINNRYSDMKGMVVTTNLNAGQIVEKFGNAIASRLLSGVKFGMGGNDMRV